MRMYVFININLLTSGNPQLAQYTAHEIYGRSRVFRVGYMGYHGITVYSQPHVASSQMELQEGMDLAPPLIMRISRFFLDLLIRRFAKLLLKGT